MMALVVIFFILIFMALGGTYLNIDPYDNLLLLRTLIAFVIMTISMMIVPFIYKISKSGEEVNTKGRKLCNYNFFCVLLLYFILDILLMGGIYDETFQNLGANLVYGLMYLYINKRVFFGSKLTKDIVNSTENKSSPISQSTDNSISKQSSSIVSNKPISVKYCSACGKPINPTTKVCSGCGKQYFKGINWETFLKVLYVLITVLSLLLNVVLFVNINNGTTDYTELEEENKELRSELIEWKQKYNTAKESLDYYEDDYSDIENKLAFYDSVVVFVENDGTDYYHKYECNRFIGNDFWAYNVEYAEYLGYTACPKCYH